MGIPSYFSYIIKNHSNIIRDLQYHQNVVKTAFSYLYMDCNSIIYDAFRTIEKNYVPNGTPLETKIIQAVIDNIRKYIIMIKPSICVYIAFDGVAPFAKMEQQRTRRYKSQFMSTLSFGDSAKPAPIWNTAAITPGTAFMKHLTSEIEREFEHAAGKYGCKKILVSGSNQEGEGEHKMYEHCRRHVKTSDNVAIYGLDSDLIMLSIFHLQYCRNMYIFREAPAFGHLAKKQDNLPLFLNIQELVKSIMTEMDCSYNDKRRVHDYVFLCFFLGNDFLPHFPALNIRTHGIQSLLDSYRQVLGHKPQFLIENGQIAWHNLRPLIALLAKCEHSWLLEEYKMREKWDKHFWSQKTEQEREEHFMSAPVVFRAEEKYICPSEVFWEKRYYNTLFDKEQNVESISVNYLEGLEWVYKYYTSGCPDWKWKYNYHYPPLFVDLVKYVPYEECTLILPNTNKAFLPNTQLAYVLPPEQFTLLPVKIKDYLLDNFPQHYGNMQFQWAFCRYFWEAHSVGLHMDLELLEKIDGVFLHQEVEN